MRTATLYETCEHQPGDHVVCGGPKAVYQLSEPIVYDDDCPPTPFVFVSAATVLGMPETYAFPCDEKGEVLSWSELDGSQKGTASHAQVLADMGYKLVAPPLPGEEGKP